MRTFKVIFPLVFIFIFGIQDTSAQNWLWAEACSGSGTSQRATAVCTDTSGNLLVAGSFWGLNMIIGNITLTNSSTNQTDFYVAKFDPSGNVLWAKSAHGNLLDFAKAISTDDSGNVYVVGQFSSPSLTFGSITITSVNSSPDAFIAKYDKNGNEIWVKDIGGNGVDQVCSVKTMPGGFIMVAGTFDNSLYFGTIHLVPAGPGDIFVVKYLFDGSVLWATCAGGSDTEIAYGADLTPNDEIYVTGYYKSPTFTFGTYTLTNSTVSPDVFLLKFDANGNPLWAKSGNGIYGNVGYSVSTDAAGNVYMTGSYASDSIHFGNAYLVNSGTNGFDDSFITKYNANGSLCWTKKFGGTGKDVGYCVSTDQNWNLYAVGWMASFTALYDNYLPFNTPVNAYDPIYILKLDSSGLPLCNNVLASGGQFMFGICTDRLNHAYIGSHFYPSSLIVGSDTLTGAANAVKVYVAKYNCMLSTGEEDNEILKNISIYPNPSTGEFDLELPEGTLKNKIVSVKIFNLQGEEVGAWIFNSDTEKIHFDIQNQAYGIYFLRAEFENKCFYSKIIKE